MTKMVGAAEFKAKCLKLIDEMQHDGESVTITRRGKPVATLSVAREEKPRHGPLFGSMKGTGTIIGDIEAPIDPDWEARWDAKWNDKLSNDEARR